MLSVNGQMYACSMQCYINGDRSLTAAEINANMQYRGASEGCWGELEEEEIERRQ